MTHSHLFFRCFQYPLVFFLFFGFSAFSQDTIFYDKDWKELVSLAGADYYQIQETSPEDVDRGWVRTYYKGGQIKTEDFYSSLQEDEKSGMSRTWDAEGRRMREIFYFKGKRHGNLITYWENGQLRRKDEYLRGDLKAGTCWNEQGEEVEYFPYEIRPEFPGGLNALKAYLKKNTTYPKAALPPGEELKLHVSFVIDTEGMVTDIKVDESENKQLMLAAYIVVENMPDWTPGYIDGEAVRVHYALPFRFRY